MTELIVLGFSSSHVVKGVNIWEIMKIINLIFYYIHVSNFFIFSRVFRRYRRDEEG